ncbi:hypothetical protein F4808DRAFT_432718 [Astrocystis sublimbata]|nr:hypothetical protein F4808DRAFT_432718 [Astrocystis sublimbata]
MTVLPPDPYKVLGVARDAQIPEIRSAHRKLVLKCHPDKIQDPTLKEQKQREFQQVQQAYELLSNELEREKYDRKFDAYEVRERESAKPTSTRGPSSKESTYYNVHVKNASPRATTFSKSSPYGRTPPRSWEDTSNAARMFEEAAHYARKTASYEKDRPSRRDEDRRRRKELEEEWAREKEREKERAKEARKAKERKEDKERIARAEEREKAREREKRKEKEKKSHSDRDKERTKDRRSATAEKHATRHRHVIVESDDTSSSSESSVHPDSSDDDVVYERRPSKSDMKKSSSSRKTEEVVEPSSLDRTRKYSDNIGSAIDYLTRSGGKAPSFVKAKTFSEGSSKLYGTPAVPTPPPASNAPFAPPVPHVHEPDQISDDEVVMRSAARSHPRRMSQDTPRSSKEKPSPHKKSSSSRDYKDVIDEDGPIRHVPTMPRSQTETYVTRPPAGLSRAETWYPSTNHERERHERSRSRHMPTYPEDVESDDDRERRRRRNRHTQSPEPTSRRYAVNDNKAVPIRTKQYHDSPRGSYKTSKSAYVIPNSSARVQRPSKSYSHSRDYYEDERQQQYFPGGVKYSSTFDANDIRYSEMPYRGSSYRSDVIA